MTFVVSINLNKYMPLEAKTWYASLLMFYSCVCALPYAHQRNPTTCDIVHQTTQNAQYIHIVVLMLY